MMYVDVVRDFVIRTRLNLEYIEKGGREKPGQVYEATQLINSMLGLLIFPVEKYLAHINKLDLSDEERELFESLTFEKGSNRNLGDSIKKLRNAFAHHNIEVIPGSQNEIKELRLWNIDPHSGARNWQVVVSIADLRRITFGLLELLERHERPLSRVPPVSDAGEEEEDE